jgi:uncharacterized protein
MDASEDRIFAVDMLRGAAVLAGIFALAFAMGVPRAAVFHPILAGQSLTGQAAWLASFVLLGGKIHAIFAMLFGLSGLLVIDRAELDGQDGYAMQRRRLLWLLPFGVVYALLLNAGDILIVLAVAGLLVQRFLGQEPLALLKAAFAFFALQWLVVAALVGLTVWPHTPESYAALLGKSLVHDVLLYRDGYGSLLAIRVLGAPGSFATHIVLLLMDSMAFMLLGMAMAKGGFFAGQWTRETCIKTARHTYLAGGIPSILIALWALRTTDPRMPEVLLEALAFPFRIPIVIGHAALLMIVPANRLSNRIAAVGRLALSNYFLCTLLLVILFEGSGFGIYGRLDFAGLLGVAAVLSVFALIWSPLWLSRFGQGPAERLWRKLYQRG